MKINLLFSILCIISSAVIKAQNLSAYTDYRNYFYVFDDGDFKNIEYNPIKSYKIGGNSVVYLNNSDNLKIYYKGSSYDFADVTPEVFYAADDIAAYTKDKILTVFDRGRFHTLSALVNYYTVSDSLVGFFDETTSIFKVYYDGSIQELDALNNVDFKVGSNTLAFVNRVGYFKIFYHDQVFEIETNQPESYKAACNTVAYVDGNSQSFKVFYNGTTVTLENAPPTSYQVAENIVAYVDNTGRFKVFCQGQTAEVLSFEPLFYSTEDNIIVYDDKVHFKVFYKGTTYTLEDYVPEEYQKDFNSLAYKDRDGYLKVFYDGETQRVSQEKINSFELSRNVVKFNTGLDDLHFFSKGKTY